jgi:hypothetical protein
MLPSITLGANVTSIYDSAFERCSNLTGIVIPEKVTRIEIATFHSCMNLVTVNLPAGITYIGRDAFMLCSSLRTINFAGTMAQWNAMERDENWKDYVSNFDVVCIDGVIEAYMVL